MKSLLLLLIFVGIPLSFALATEVFPVPPSVVRQALEGRHGTFILIDCATRQISDFDPEGSATPLAPCSTFKIWNTLFGLETQSIDPQQSNFYKWDGVERSISTWNKDLTLKEAFQASCVPAFQALARTIGADAMSKWIQKIGYGDQDISAGIDVFWLPAKDRKTILISPKAEAELLCKLANQELPFSQNSMTTLLSIMQVKKTDKGVLYGKTGSKGAGDGTYDMGWFVGFIEGKQGKYAFACNVQGANTGGKEARAITEKILEIQGLL